jgi:hypothetical protein
MQKTNLTTIPFAPYLIANSASIGESIPLQIIGNFVNFFIDSTFVHVVEPVRKFCLTIISDKFILGIGMLVCNSGSVLFDASSNIGNV